MSFVDDAMKQRVKYVCLSDVTNDEIGINSIMKQHLKTPYFRLGSLFLSGLLSLTFD